MSFWPTRSRSFTLVEVLVALTVAAVGLVGAIGALSIAGSAASRVEHLRHAQLLAESRLNLAVIDSLPQMGKNEGSDGRFTWIVEITRTGVMVFGRMCLNIMGHRLRPITRAASTYSLLFSPSTDARTVLA